MTPMRRPQQGPIGTVLSSGVDLPASGLEAPQFMPIQTPPMMQPQQKEGGGIAQGIMGLGKALMQPSEGSMSGGSNFSLPTERMTAQHEAGNAMGQGGGLSDLMSKFKGLGAMFK